MVSSEPELFGRTCPLCRHTRAASRVTLPPGVIYAVEQQIAGVYRPVGRRGAEGVPEGMEDKSKGDFFMHIDAYLKTHQVHGMLTHNTHAQCAIWCARVLLM